MSDFIFSSTSQPYGALTSSLATIYLTGNNMTGSSEFHGEWGSLAVTPSRYHGYQPVETDSHICVVIGGPVLYFQNNSFLEEADPQAGTRAILERWSTGSADWSEDVSGPFVILIINKITLQVDCITDLMMFIPVYQFSKKHSMFWSTHIDVLANSCGEREVFDEASIVDFVLNHAVTYPYTAYQNLRQCQPGSIHTWENESGTLSGAAKAEYYWQPLERHSYANLNEAAIALREGVKGYIERVTEPMSSVAQFISAGEDSRVLTGLLPQRLQRDAYIFLDEMNREGRVAEKVAKVYEANFKPSYRRQTHYLDILPEASRLVGTGHKYTHAHTLGFDEKLKLSAYGAVFGGYISDSLLKAEYAYKPKWMERFSFIPQIAKKGEERTTPISHGLFPSLILAEITRRRRAHYSYVKEVRPSTSHEWFELWPATMRVTIPNLYSNRRLFASYEVFMAKESVKVAASVPVNWKLNRRLFHRAFKPALKKTRFVFHADGRLPYYPWWVNSTIQMPIWFYQQFEKVLRVTGLHKKNQGSWADWRSLLASDRWNEDVDRYTNDYSQDEVGVRLQPGALIDSSLSRASKVSLLQVFFHIHNRVKKEHIVKEPPLLED